MGAEVLDGGAQKCSFPMGMVPYGWKCSVYKRTRHRGRPCSFLSSPAPLPEVPSKMKLLSRSFLSLCTFFLLLCLATVFIYHLRVMTSVKTTRTESVAPPSPHLPLVNCSAVASTEATRASTHEVLNHFDPIAPPYAFPAWIQDVCPEVVQHFTRFPYFSSFHATLPLMTTGYAAHSVCTMKYVDLLAKDLGVSLYLYAGSFFGALVHGGPIPWDDDGDVIIHASHKDAFMAACQKHTLLSCVWHPTHIKAWIETPESLRLPYPWKSPFIDVFLYREEKGTLLEVKPDGGGTPYLYPPGSFFPARKYYYAGLLLLGPQPSMASSRYNLDLCMAPRWNHRLEKTSPYRGSFTLDCCMLTPFFPFVYRDGTLDNGNLGTASPQVAPWWSY